MKTKIDLKKEFMQLIGDLDTTQLEEFHEELYPDDLERDLEMECIEYFDWYDNSPKRQKEIIISQTKFWQVKAYGLSFLTINL